MIKLFNAEFGDAVSAGRAELGILTSLHGCSSPKKMPRMMAGMMINHPPVATKPIHIMSGWFLNKITTNVSHDGKSLV
jgi:hypothetical protein